MANQAKADKTRWVARVVCTLPNDETRILYASRLSTTEAFIGSFQPIPLHTELVLQFEFSRTPPLPPVYARVISNVVDASDISRTGFGVTFVLQTDADRAALRDALSVAGLPIGLLSRGRWTERRCQPRIWVDTELIAVVEIGQRTARAHVANLSLSGALLTFGDMGVPAALVPDTEVSLLLSADDASTTISVGARVVRRTKPPEPPGVGVSFVNVDGALAQEIESLILRLVGHIDGAFGV